MFNLATFHNASICIGLLLAACTRSYGAMTLTLLDGAAPTDAVSISPGGSLTVTMRINSDIPFLGFSAFLQDPGYTGTARFTIANRTRLATNPFTAGQETTDSASFASEPVDAKTLDLGYVKGSAAVAAGGYDLMTLQITAAPTLEAGQYVIRFDPASVLVDGGLNPVAFTNLTTVSDYYTVTIVPEPGTAMALVGMTLSCGMRRRNWVA